MGRSGDEALPLLLTLSSGVKGFTTIHAGSARQALTRLRFVCQLADRGEIPMAALNNLVSDAVDIVVHCARVDGAPRVTEIVAVEDQQGGPDSPLFTVTDVFRRAPLDGLLRWTGNVPVRAARAFEEAGLDLRALLDDGRRPPPDRS